MNDLEVFQESIDKLFAERMTKKNHRDADRGLWLDELWKEFAQLGLPWISIPEKQGGSGGSLTELGALLFSVGKYAIPLPMAETAMLGGWLLSLGNFPIPQDPVTVPANPRGDITLIKRSNDWLASGILYRVPWARNAKELVLLSEYHNEVVIVSVPLARCQVRLGKNIANEPRDTVILENVPLEEDMVKIPIQKVQPDTLLLRGALSRSLMMAGAMENIAEVTLAYSEARHQFGRPIAAFQAIQQHLVRLASEAEGAGMAALVALNRYSDGDSRFEVASAKSTNNNAAGIVAALAHQVHGAIGMTEEYDLHYFTKRLWSWRGEFGSSNYWNTRLGKQVTLLGADSLWPRLATGIVEQTLTDFPNNK